MGQKIQNKIYREHVFEYCLPDLHRNNFMKLFPILQLKIYK